jgi:hypothetical protein
LLGAAAAGRAANITYNVSVLVGAGSVNGHIVTDGQAGPLVAGDFVDWDLVVSDGTDPSVELTGANSSFSCIGFCPGSMGLTATPAELRFDFLGPGAYQFSGLGTDLCFEGGIPSCSNANNPGWSIFDSAGTVGIQYTPEDGSQAIGTSNVPEPSTAAGMCLGVAVVGLLRRRRGVSQEK